MSAQFQDFADSYSTLSTIAGKGNMDESGVIGWKPEFENGDAMAAELTRPHFAMADSAGNIYIADKDAHGIRMVTPEGIIQTVAGTSVAGDNGDGLGTESQLHSPNGLWVKNDGTVYILDLGNNKIRRLNGDGNLVYRISKDRSVNEIIAGNGTGFGGGTGYAATETGLDGVRGVWFLEDNSYFVATHEGSQIWYIDVTGSIHLFLDGKDGDEYHSGDGEDYRTPGLKISEPRSVTVDYHGNVIITENDNGFIRKIKNDYTYFYTSAINYALTAPVIHIFPNPAHLESTVQFTLQESSMVKVILLNSLGQQLNVLMDDARDKGLISLTVDLSEITSGIYFYRIQTGTDEVTRKLIVQ